MRQARPRGMHGRTRSHPKVTGKRAWNKKADRHEVEGTYLQIIRSLLRKACSQVLAPKWDCEVRADQPMGRNSISYPARATEKQFIL